MTPVGNYYHLKEYNVSGAVYDTILELNKYDITDDWIIDYSLGLDECDYPNAQSQIEHLEFTRGEAFPQITIGRFAYNDIEIHQDGEVIPAKQIFGAYIDSEHSRVGLGLDVYSLLISTYGCLVSDNTQSISGSTFWAQRLAMDFDVYTYDTTEKAVIEKFIFDGENYCFNEVPWSIDITDVNMDSIDRIRLPYDKDEDKSHIVLFTRG